VTESAVLKGTLLDKFGVNVYVYALIIVNTGEKYE
jgi:hypothetical protein